MNDSELFDRYARMNLPTSFRVIGIGEATKEIIETVSHTDTIVCPPQY